MSVWDDMAHDAGYRGDEARQVARMIEEEERAKHEQRDFDPCPMCGRATEDPYGGPCEACWEKTADASGACDRLYCNDTIGPCDRCPSGVR